MCVVIIHAVCLLIGSGWYLVVVFRELGQMVGGAGYVNMRDCFMDCLLAVREGGVD